MLQEPTRQVLQEGLVLFNERRFWDAHEAWEAAWRTERGEVRQLLQGLIQVAAGYHKALEHRQPRPAARLLAAGLARLEPIPDSLSGLRLGPLRAAVASSLEAVRAWERGEGQALDPDGAPRIELDGSMGGPLSPAAPPSAGTPSSAGRGRGA
jgi:predicted metal-dependent hydrolase